VWRGLVLSFRVLGRCTTVVIVGVRDGSLPGNESVHVLVAADGERRDGVLPGQLL
jgi:hypothetical protein